MSTAAPPAAPVVQQQNAGQSPAQADNSAQSGRDEKGRFVPGQKSQLESQAATEQPKAKLKIKDLELDEDAAFREIQRGRQSSKLLTEAQKRIEAAEAKERAEAERTAKYKSDLNEFFKDRGFSPEEAKKLASEYLYKNVIEPEEMSPEARKNRELDARLKEYEAKEAEQKSAAEKAEQDRLVQEQAKAVENELIQAMESGVLPKEKDFIGYVAREMSKFAERGVEISVEQGVRLAEEKLGRLGGKVLATADIDRLQSWLGKEVFNSLAMKFLKWGMAKAGPKQAAQAPSPQPTSAPRKKMTPQEFIARQREMGIK